MHEVRVRPVRRRGGFEFSGRGFTGEQWAEVFKDPGVAVRVRLFAQPVQGVVHHGDRPVAIVGALRRFDSGILGLETGLRVLKAQWSHASAPLGRSPSVPLIGQETGDGREKEGAKAAAILLHTGQPFLGQQAGEELLGAVLSIRWCHAPTAGESVDRVPIGAAELLERGLMARCARLAGGQHHAPMGGCENKGFAGTPVHDAVLFPPPTAFKRESWQSATQGASRHCPRMERGGDVLVASGRGWSGNEDVAAP